MPDASAIRMGGAYVEISADDSPMLRRLRESQARLKAWAAENSGGMTISRGTEAALAGQGGTAPTFFRGSFKGTELVEGGLKFAAAIAATKAAIADVHIYSALFRGDMEGARKAAEELPFGLGTIVKELSGPIDSAMNALVARLSGTWQMGFQVGGNRQEIKAVVDQYNRGVVAIRDVDKALAKATLSARDLAKQEVAGLKLSADAAAELLAKKLQLIQVDEQQKAAARFRAERERGQGLIDRAMADYAKATLSEEDYIASEVRGLGLAADQAEQLLQWRLAILAVSKEQKKAEDRGRFSENFAETVGAIQREMGVLRGTLDAFDVEVAKAARPLDEALAKNLITINEYQGRLQELKAAMAGLKEVKAADALKKEGQALSESLQTPEERAKAEIDKARRLLDSGAIGSDTYERAVRKALEDAASAMPEVARQTIGVRGTFNAMEAAGLGAGGIADAMLEAQRQTAKNTEKIAQLAANLGVTFN